ncbi:hypothetical protein EZV76_13285 [Flagellimonas alvinocaridis]|uniref:SIR2-like domain-containing protein n=1 Tax=Flagellimonas alvinocaridis TaxID=2530200 RepID=A0A4S8RVQ4_9FLAO|nr:SIR2 family protein [Allomuricauda alvinocaridis]THV58054.1 hypothetical protein EZV76_13285 [Allomuricauda alvinocaridis]
MRIEVLKNTFESCNINFLVGSGLSKPYLITLGNIETLLEELEYFEEIDEIARYIIRASIYKRYFNEVMAKNLDTYKFKKSPDVDEEKDYSKVSSNYKYFLQLINTIMLYRYIPIHNKQINIFTTNIDLFFEKALEETKLEFNDGFKGRINPIFNLSNFQKSYRKTSLHYKNTSEIPVFNLLKLHGSMNWTEWSNQIVLSSFKEFESISNAIDVIPNTSLLSINDKSELKQLVEEASKIVGSLKGKEKTELKESCLNFFLEYSKLQIVNPTKEKFKTTLLNTNYYELLRLFANEMEKENTLLFALGFSFADEHVREITIRAVNSNPTLQLYVIAFDENAKKDIERALGFADNRILNGNVQVIHPESYCAINKEEEGLTPFECFSFENINNQLFQIISNKINPSIKTYGQ